jgi:hypothetical protein
MKTAFANKVATFFICLLITTNSFSQKDKGFNFPPGFGSKETLLIIGPASKDKVTEGIIEAFEKEYKGKIQLIQDRYGKNVKADSAKNVFLLTVLEMPSAVPNTNDYKFGLINIYTRKSYECDFWSGAYKKGARYYAKNLEEFRLANGGK